VVLSKQIIPGSFAFALNYLVDSELDLSALDAKLKNDDTGASAYTQPIASSAQLA
ncbi:MAG: IS1182 family transposase, partial [Actinobacteria bacterium]|nr:IS1182 family transposase [Actinomycetota bacterium]